MELSIPHKPMELSIPHKNHQNIDLISKKNSIYVMTLNNKSYKKHAYGKKYEI